MTKWQFTFLCIMTGYRKVIKLLQKGYKSYKIVISISLSPLGGYPPDTRGCMPLMAPCTRVYVQRSCVWGAVSCVRRCGQLRFKRSHGSRVAVLQGKLRLSGALPLWETTTLDYESLRGKKKLLTFL